jgi:hypothetical protein
MAVGDRPHGELQGADRSRRWRASLDEDDGADGEEDVLAEEQADIVGAAR